MNAKPTYGVVTPDVRVNALFGDTLTLSPAVVSGTSCVALSLRGGGQGIFHPEDLKTAFAKLEADR